VNLPMAPLDTPPALAPEDVPALQDEVRALARRRDAVILAHNYQRPEVQDVARKRGD
jgi:quinolinate synthase